MATPATYSNPASEATNPEDEKARSDYERGRDVDLPSERQTQTDLSKGVDLEKGGERSHVDSNRSEEQTLSGDDAPANETIEEVDPHVVGWDGPDDPENPQNWPDSKKWGIIGVLAAVTLVTYVGSSPIPKRNNES
jgi:hypothetical protein